MKETLTLLERCQREAREKVFNINNYNGSSVGSITLKDLNDLIANTLKQAAEEIGKMRQSFMPDSYSDDWDNISRTEAQKILLGENND